MGTVADVERRSYEGELLFIVEVCHAMANLIWCGVVWMAVACAPSQTSSALHMRESYCSIVEVCHAMASLVWCGVNGHG